MGTFSISNEKQTGNYIYESGLYKVTGNCRYNLETNKFDSADGSIYKEDINIGYFNSYTEINNGIKTNINNVSPEILNEVSSIITECLASIGEYYKQ